MSGLPVESDALELVLAWHAALNAADADRLVALSASDVEVGGPRGGGRGVDLLRDWVARAHIQLEPLRWQAQEAVVVVEQKASWQTPDGQMTEPHTLASIFRLDDGRVASVIRVDDFATALGAAGLRPGAAG
ncbi:MAG: nuclear transport factor 2 family protein [Chloroflexi bacterium]|nr:nuclear transport factor 2 family protein [Chloroflexota bacterium]